MFGLMKSARSNAGDMNAVKGSVLGAHIGRRSEGVDPAASALVQLSAAALPKMSGAMMTALERVLKMEPRQKPALRKFIADSYAAAPTINSAVRSYKRSHAPRHDDCYRLAAQLCDVARQAGRADSRSISQIIAAAKSLGLTQPEVLQILQKARLTA